MALEDVKISNLPELAVAPAVNDMVPIMDTSVTITKRISVANLLSPHTHDEGQGYILGNTSGNLWIHTTFLMIAADGAGGLKVGTHNVFNSIIISPMYVLSKSTEDTYFIFDASGTILKLKYTKPTGRNVVAVLSSSIIYDATGVAHTAEIHHDPVSNCVMIQDICVIPGSGSSIDLTTMATNQTLEMYISWLTIPA